MDWFLYDNGLLHERVNRYIYIFVNICIYVTMICKHIIHIYVNIAVEVGKKGNYISLFVLLTDYQ